jgi:hypothetical protein
MGRTWFQRQHPIDPGKQIPKPSTDTTAPALEPLASMPYSSSHLPHAMGRTWSNINTPLTQGLQYSVQSNHTATHLSLSLWPQCLSAPATCHTLKSVHVHQQHHRTTNSPTTEPQDYKQSSNRTTRPQMPTSLYDAAVHLSLSPWPQCLSAPATCQML